MWRRTLEAKPLHRRPMLYAGRAGIVLGDSERSMLETNKIGRTGGTDARRRGFAGAFQDGGGCSRR
ncbi:hypothetical protein QV13_24425 [Mesorhizobium hungaricum]|uniref:Uncharacterized protein n=1 Tax=Mesorhizobium hungaricum TaxID=1566387 RepID=A0A1C2DDF5_9HYPH|nr:hypothetical protein QV13_24425 [Mesorhizobium hungaricum]